MTTHYTPRTVTELKQHVADSVGLEPEELSDTKLCKLLGFKRGRYLGWAANTHGTIPPVARPDVRDALVKLRASHDDGHAHGPGEHPPERPEQPHSYISRGFYFTGEEFLRMDPETQRHVLSICEKGNIRAVEEE